MEASLFWSRDTLFLLEIRKEAYKLSTATAAIFVNYKEYDFRLKQTPH